MALICLLGSAAFATASQKTVSETRLKDGGELVSKNEFTVINKGELIIVAGRKDDFDKEKGNIVTYATAEYMILGDDFTFLDYSQKSFRAQKLIINSTIKYEWRGLVGSFFLEDIENNKTYKKDIDIDGRFIPVQVLSEYLSQKISEKINDVTFKLTFPTGDSIGMKATFSNEPISVEAFGKAYGCYTVEMKPNFGFISGLIPSSKYYFEVASPHRLIRYEGTKGGPGTPDIIQVFKY